MNDDTLTSRLARALDRLLRVAGAAALLAVPFALFGSPVTGLRSFSNDTVADADDVNANFAAVATAVNDNAGKLGKFSFSGDNVGIGVTPVQPRFRVDGAVLFGTGAETCDATTNGMLRVKDERLEYCAASRWHTLVAVPATAAQVELVGGSRRWSDGTYAASCNDYRTPAAGYVYAGATGSGLYTIRQNASATPTVVYCEMVLASGGWTQVFVGTGNHNSTSIGYVPGTAGLDSVVSRSTTMMFAFMDTSSKALSNAWTFATPAAFRTGTPMASGQCTYTSITATRVADNLTTTQLLRSGWGSFSSLCDEGCSGTYGHVCLKNNSSQGSAGGFLDFPFYTAFATAGGDLCANSNQSYSVASCTAAKEFAIFVR